MIEVIIVRKKRTIISMVVLLISLVGCNGTTVLDNTPVINEEQISLIEHEEQMTNLKNEYEKTIEELDTKNIEKLFDEFSGDSSINELVYNRSRELVAYIDAVGFETIGNVILLNVKTGERTQLTSFDYGESQTTVKQLVWYSDNELLLIVGYSYGTVTIGGSVHVLDLDTGSMKEIVKPMDNQEIMTIVEPVNSRKVTFVCAEWDDNAMNYETFIVDYEHEYIDELIDGDVIEIINVNN